MSSVPLCTWHCCQRPKAPGSWLCEVEHKSEPQTYTAPARAAGGEREAPPRDPACPACAGIHGSVNEEWHCMARELRRQRGWIQTLRAMVEKWVPL